MNVDYLETNNLILRKAKESDLQMIWKNVWNDEDIASSMLWKVTNNLEDAKKRLEKTINYQSKNYAYFVCLKSTDEPIGFAGIKETEQKGVYEESGICISKEYQGNGYAKEVVSILKKLIFEELCGNRLLYGCFSTNDKSKKVCLSLGFKYSHSEPTIREWDKKQFIVNYYYFDKEMYNES